ncbi:MAG: F0F1 ATP synthase subunit epsilon [Alphaproteobacteria bacterium]|nr:F0F1 ATP synthase subunit epsilon [Alphaproteobacteria bacterium]
MADTFQFELVAPERLIYSDQAELVVVPGAEGEFGVLPGHAPLISAVRTGIVEVFEYPAVKSKAKFFVAGGFAEVTAERCTVLSAEAVPVNEIDRDEVKQRLEQAELDLRDAQGDAEKSKAEAAVALARAMLDAAGG